MQETSASHTHTQHAVGERLKIVGLAVEEKWDIKRWIGGTAMAFL